MSKITIEELELLGKEKDELKSELDKKNSEYTFSLMGCVIQTFPSVKTHAEVLILDKKYEIALRKYQRELNKYVDQEAGYDPNTF